MFFFKDDGNNLFEMTRVAPDDKAFFQRNSDSNATLRKYYLQGNDVVLTENSGILSGSLSFSFFLRPSRLVPNDRAAYISAFTKTIGITNSSLSDGDTVTINDIVFTARSSSPGANEFLIDSSSIATAANLANAINTADIGVTASSGSPQTSIVTLSYEDVSIEFSVSNQLGTALQSTQGIKFTTACPSNFTVGSLVDFLQTRPGHRVRGMDVKIPTGGVSSDSINVPINSVPEDLIVGDYVATAGECIIPQIPTDLHTALAERTCARILSSIGDMQGLEATNQKIAEIELRQGSILDSRVEGSQIKVFARHSLLKVNKIGWRRRF